MPLAHMHANATTATTIVNMPYASVVALDVRCAPVVATDNIAIDVVDDTDVGARVPEAVGADVGVSVDGCQFAGLPLYPYAKLIVELTTTMSPLDVHLNVNPGIGVSVL